MNGPIGNYYDRECFMVIDGIVHQFPNELAMERYVVRCPHTNTVIAGSWGLRFCTNCWAIPRRRVNA